MQIYTDQNGIQQYTPDEVSIDSDSGLYVHSVIWTGDFDTAKVGGYSVVEGELVYSQAAFDANEALKISVAEAVLGGAVAAKRAAAIAALDNATVSPTELVIALKAIVLLMLDEINVLRQCNMVHRAIAGSGAVTSVANLKTAMLNNLPVTNDRTPAQAKTAIDSKINDGDAD